MNVKPISYMKQNAANLSEELGFEPMFVTQNGVDTLVVQSSQAYHAQQEKMAFMELLLRSEKDIKNADLDNLDDFLDTL